jgi:hypothetical protein
MKGRGSNSVNNLRFSRKGQVTIFIILGIIIVAGAVLFYTFYPQIKSSVTSSNDPRAFVQSCIQDKVNEVVGNISEHGGSVNPSFYYNYEGTPVEYLCYTNEYYKTCTVQQPFLKTHIEKEIETNIASTVSTCLDEMKKSFEAKGYKVRLVKGNITAELLPQIIAITINSDLTLTKGNSQNYKKFSIVVNNNLYELVSIADSILQWEATYGDAETTVYMSYYHDLEIQKKKQSDGTTVYILTDLNNNNMFEFASRSMAWAPGYGFNQTV